MPINGVGLGSRVVAAAEGWTDRERNLIRYHRPQRVVARFHAFEHSIDSHGAEIDDIDDIRFAGMPHPSASQLGARWGWCCFCLGEPARQAEEGAEKTKDKSAIGTRCSCEEERSPRRESRLGMPSRVPGAAASSRYTIEPLPAFCRRRIDRVLTFVCSRAGRAGGVN